MVVTASAIIAVTVIVVASIFLGPYRIPFIQITVLGVNYSAIHWIGWIGALYVAIATPIYPIVKRRFPQHMKRALGLHVIGNLLGVSLASVHFAHQVTRPAAFYPDLGTGILLYSSMLLLVATGFLLISGFGKKYVKQVRFLHPAFAITFYMTVAMHAIQNL